jgi:hypothetical protein
MSDTATKFDPEWCCWAASGWEDALEGSVREIVEALRENPSAVIALESLHPLTADLALHEAADWLSRRFLSPDNPEGNA